jgi:simple sugar transport system ATP-binding protein
MRNIEKFYGRIHALRNVNLTIRRGEIVGLLGDNGAGKSTLIKVLSGAVPYTSGQIFFDGRR